MGAAPSPPEGEQTSWWLPRPETLPEPIVPPPSPSVAGAPPKLVLPVLRVVGQVGSTYVITEGPEGMYLIDQHAAHERVLYERIVRARAESSPEIQPLLDPLTFEPTAAQASAAGDYAEHLAALGFTLEPFGERSYLLRAAPAALAGRDPVRVVAEFLDAVVSAEGAPVDRAERAAMTLACHAAVRAGKTLALEEMRELVRLLELCESPRTCPHGRPTMIHVSAAALEREFGRR
jgi:DNA mismatch repair protein MutL